MVNNVHNFGLPIMDVSALHRFVAADVRSENLDNIPKTSSTDLMHFLWQSHHQKGSHIGLWIFFVYG